MRFLRKGSLITGPNVSFSEKTKKSKKRKNKQKLSISVDFVFPNLKEKLKTQLNLLSLRTENLRIYGI